MTNTTEFKAGERYIIYHRLEHAYKHVVIVEEREGRLAFVSAWDKTFFAWCDGNFGGQAIDRAW